jgi:murein DD-endopeptidase MepM/ murein hydrolase activator NlpD
VGQGEIKKSLRRALDRAFVDREIIVRSNGRSHNLRLSRRAQMVVTSAAVALIAWTAVAGAGLVWQERLLAERSQEIRRHQAAQDELTAEISAYRDQFVNLAEGLDREQAALAELLGSEEAAGKIIDYTATAGSSQAEVEPWIAARTKLDGLQSDLAKAAEYSATLRAEAARLAGLLERTQTESAIATGTREELRSELASLEQALSGVNSERQALNGEVSALESQLIEALQDRRRSERENRRLTREMAKLSEGLSGAEAAEATLQDRNQQLRATYEARLLEMKDSYQTRLSATESSYGARLETKDLALVGAKNRGERLARERDQFRGQAASLTRRLEELSEAQQSVVDRLIERTLADIEALEKTVALTELDFEAVMDRTKIEPMSQGGPFLPIAIPVNRSNPAHFQSAMGLLDLHLDRWEALNKAVRQIPLAAPLDEYRISSRYGIRTDPVNGKRAKHDGLDLKAPRRTLIFSPASGTVVFAGWKGHYGRVVEIDHGNGIHTLYAHLHKILVEKGEVVEASDRIGLVGNSGRTTGPHLHYEIQVDGRPTDPLKFLRAGKRTVQG